MKKTYFKPETDSIVMHAMGALCASLVTSNTTTPEPSIPGPPVPGKKVF